MPVFKELLTADGKAVSTNLLFFELPKSLQLPSATIRWDLAKSGNSFTLRLSSDVLARDVFVSAGDLDVTYSDNYVDLLPGQSVEIELKSTATLEALRSALKVTSLVDAFRTAGGAVVAAPGAN